MKKIKTKPGRRWAARVTTSGLLDVQPLRVRQLAQNLEFDDHSYYVDDSDVCFSGAVVSRNAGYVDAIDFLHKDKSVVQTWIDGVLSLQQVCAFHWGSNVRAAHNAPELDARPIKRKEKK